MPRLKIVEPRDADVPVSAPKILKPTSYGPPTPMKTNKYSPYKHNPLGRKARFKPAPAKIRDSIGSTTPSFVLPPQSNSPLSPETSPPKTRSPDTPKVNKNLCYIVNPYAKKAPTQPNAFKCEITISMNQILERLVADLSKAVAEKVIKEKELLDGFVEGVLPKLGKRMKVTYNEPRKKTK